MARYFNDFFGPLRRWCHAILPTVYDDSLSYYEVLCKLSRHVNDLGDIINNIINTGSWNAVIAYTRPEFFGAEGDGVTDDTDAVIAAINDADNNSKFLLLKGNYLIKTSLTVPSGLVVVGQGTGGKLISAQEARTGFVPTTLLNISGSCAFSGVTFDGNAPAGASIAQGSMNSDYTDNHPLIRINGGRNIVFNQCRFTNYDTNWSVNNPAGSKEYACVGASNAAFVYFNNCTFSRVRRECTVFKNCSDITFDGCSFDMGNEPGVAYSEIGLDHTDNVRVANCFIKKGDNVSASVINCVGNNITVEGCNIRGIYSKFGIDYGDEGNSGIARSGLFIKNNVLKTPIRSASGNNAIFDNIVIEGNQIDCTGFAWSSGGVIAHGGEGEHIHIRDNDFYGEIKSPVTCALRLAQDNAVIDIDGNTFRVTPGEGLSNAFAIQLGGITEGVTIRNCLMECAGIRNITVPGDGGELSMVSCRVTGQLAYAQSGNTIKIVCVGCDLNNTTTSHMPIDSTKSYVRSGANESSKDFNTDDSEDDESETP